MVRPLPVRPSLTHARNEAKAILRAHRRKERGCCAVLRHLKKLGDASDDQILATELTLADVQYALAVDYGYASWAKLKVRVEQSAPPILVHPPMRWFHGSPYRLATLRPGSTVTPIVELARAFAHGPARVNINIREDDIAPNRSVVIEHNGKREGFLYEVTVADPDVDLRPHPESTMAPGEEMLTTRELPLKLVSILSADEPARLEFADTSAKANAAPSSDAIALHGVNWAEEDEAIDDAEEDHDGGAPDRTRFTGQLKLKGDAFEGYAPGDVVRITGQVVFTSAVTAIPKCRLRITGQLIAPEGSERMLAPAIAKMTGQAVYYPDGVMPRIVLRTQTFDQTFFEALTEKEVLINLGVMCFAPDVQSQTFKERIHSVINLGVVRCSRSLRPFVQVICRDSLGKIEAE